MTVLDGIVIGGAGGAIAGITVWLVQYLDTKGVEAIERHRVHQWLRENTKNEEGQRYRPTRAIAALRPSSTLPCLSLTPLRSALSSRLAKRRSECVRS